MPRLLNNLFQLINAPVCRKMYGALEHVHANRPVESIDTIIIGDLCDERTLKQVCSLDHSLKILFPGRSLASSKLILGHLTSVLREGENVVIVNKGIMEGITYFDYPFLSQISRAELNMTKKSRRIYYPLLFAPVRSLKLLMGLACSNFKITNCPDKEIEDLCKRKKFNLIYLSNKDH